MLSHHRWPLLLMVIASTPASGSATAQVGGRPQASLVEHEQTISGTLTRNLQFVDVLHLSVRLRCEQTKPPRPLTTPSPLLSAAEEGLKVKVSFIIGADGRVYSPLILESGGMAEDGVVLRAVRSWRYRPAMCNGVPTDIEGKVEFSVQ